MSDRSPSERGFTIAVLLAVLAGVVFAFWLFERIVATG